MIETNKIQKSNYYYNIIPDIGYIEWYEKNYWTTTNTNQSYTSEDGLFSYYIKDDDQPYIDIQSYRALILSDFPLSLTDSKKYDTILQRLENYAGRYVYIAISSDIDIYKESIKVQPSVANNDFNISVLRF